MAGAELARCFAPVFAFHPDERFLPIDAADYLVASQLRFADGSTMTMTYDEFAAWVATTPTDAQVASTLFLPDGPRSQVMRAAPELLHWPAYYDVLHVDDDNTYITYYLFYACNPALRTLCGCACCGYHLADIEGVQVHVHKGELARVYYSKHSGGSWVDAADLQIAEGTHPRVWVALASHACYESPGMHWRFGGVVPDWTSSAGQSGQPGQLLTIEGPLLYQGTWGDGHVSGFPQKSNWRKVEVDGPWRCS